MKTETINPELISHPLCPFNQRLAISLIRLGKVRDKDFRVNYVDLADLPDWFLAISPQKAMPVLRSEKGEIHFDVDDILAEITRNFEHRDLSADETLAVTLADDLLNTMRVMFTETTVDSVDAAVATVMEKLRSVPADAAAIVRVETNQGDLREVVFAPVFSLLLSNPGLVEEIRRMLPPDIAEYGRLLAEHPHTHASRCPNYLDEFEKFFALFHSAYPVWEKQQIV